MRVVALAGGFDLLQLQRALTLAVANTSGVVNASQLVKAAGVVGGVRVDQVRVTQLSRSPDGGTLGGVVSTRENTENKTNT